MSRARSTSRNRDITPIASPLNSLLVRPKLTPLIRIEPPSDLREVEDRRRFNPGRVRPAASLYSPRHTLQIPWQLTRSRWPLSIPTGVQFVDAKNVLICIRRRIRKEVMFAVKRKSIGLGRKHSWPWQKKRHRFNDHSKIRC